MANRKYMVTSNGISKKDGSAYSIGKQMCESKKTGCAFLLDKQSYFLNDIKPLGYIFEVSQNLVEE